MSVVVALLAGGVAGWLAHRLFHKWAPKIGFGNDDTRAQILDSLGYEALLKLKASLDAELAKRKGKGTA